MNLDERLIYRRYNKKQIVKKIREAITAKKMKRINKNVVAVIKKEFLKKQRR